MYISDLIALLDYLFYYNFIFLMEYFFPVQLYVMNSMCNCSYLMKKKNYIFLYVSTARRIKNNFLDFPTVAFVMIYSIKHIIVRQNIFHSYTKNVVLVSRIYKIVLFSRNSKWESGVFLTGVLMLWGVGHIYRHIWSWVVLSDFLWSFNRI